MKNNFAYRCKALSETCKNWFSFSTFNVQRTLACCLSPYNASDLLQKALKVYSYSPASEAFGITLAVDERKASGVCVLICLWATNWRREQRATHERWQYYSSAEPRNSLPPEWQMNYHSSDSRWRIKKWAAVRALGASERRIEWAKRQQVLYCI